MKILFTGGHHTSALPIISVLKKDHKEIELFWVGHKHTSSKNKRQSLEYIEITQLKLPFYNLYAGKFYKNYNFLNLIKIPFGFIQSFFLLLKIKPDVVMSFGGYLSVPIVLVAKILNIKCFTHEQTVTLGYANKLISKYVDIIFVTWPQSVKYFDKSKVVLTGIPLREQIFKPTTNEYMINNQLPTIYITRGKSGSHIINLTIQKIIPDLLDFCNVIHQSGDNSQFQDYDQIKEFTQLLTEKKGRYFIKKFVTINEIGEVYNKCDLVVSRSGAHTISELIALEKPSILIPIPWSSHDEQFKNAKMLVDLGISQIIEEKDLDGLYLLNKIKDMLLSLNSYKLKDLSIRDNLFKDSTSIIVNEILKIRKAK